MKRSINKGRCVCVSSTTFIAKDVTLTHLNKKQPTTLS